MHFFSKANEAIASERVWLGVSPTNILKHSREPQEIGRAHLNRIHRTSPWLLRTTSFFIPVKTPLSLSLQSDLKILNLVSFGLVPTEAAIEGFPGRKVSLTMMTNSLLIFRQESTQNLASWR